MAKGQDEIPRATAEPLPADHELLRHGRWAVLGIKDVEWRGGVRLTVPRSGDQGEDRFIFRGCVVVQTGEPMTVVCPESERRLLPPLPKDEAARIRLQHSELLDPYMRTWGPEFNPQEEPENGDDN